MILPEGIPFGQYFYMQKISQSIEKNREKWYNEL